MNSHMRSAAEISGGHMTSNTDVMVQEFVLAFDDLKKDDTNNRKLKDCVRSYYAVILNAPAFCSALQRLLTSAKKRTRQQRVNDAYIVRNFYSELTCLHTDHSVMEEKLNSMNENFSKELSSIAAFKKRYSVFFTIAAMICAAATPILAVRAFHNWAWERAGITAAAAASSILFVALGKWRQSDLKKDMTAVKKLKDITEYMIMGAQNGMEYISSIEKVALRLYPVSISLSPKAKLKSTMVR